MRKPLPLPALKDTANRYMDDLAGVLDPDALSKASVTINAFVDEEGSTLQKKLERRDRTRRGGFLCDFWRESYLVNRTSLTPWQNAAILTLGPTIPEAIPLAVQAADLIRKVVAVYRQTLLFPGKETEGKLSATLFATSRIPHLEKDVMRSARRSTHVLLIHKGQIFTIQVRRHMRQASFRSLQRAVEAILGGGCGELMPPVGLLTSLPRTEWAIQREQLKQGDARNAINLRTIETAILTLCLDDPPDNDDGLALRSLHGADGNGWHDNTIQFVLTPQGDITINLEHTVVDGLDVTDLLKQLGPQKFTDTCATFETGMPTPLQWTLPRQTREAINAIQSKLASVRDTFRASNFTLDMPADTLLAAHNLRGDFLAQFVFQASYEAVHRSFPRVYESVSMRHFSNGRTDNLRPATRFSRAAVLALRTNAETKTIIHALAIASAEHTRRLVQCMKGKGIDRHLFALECMARNTSRPVPALFKQRFHQSFMTDFQLTTSSLPSSSGSIACFINPVRHGFGIGYLKGKNRLHVCVTSCDSRHDAMCEAMQGNATKLRDLLSTDAVGALSTVQDDL